MIKKQKSSTKIEVSQRVEFTCSYLVTHGDSYQLNSHSYKFEATVELDILKTFGNRVISFDILKNLMQSVCPENAFLYQKSDKNQVELAQMFEKCGVPVFSSQSEISAEVILAWISSRLDSEIEKYIEEFGGNKVRLRDTKLRETSNSYVSWVNDR